MPELPDVENYKRYLDRTALHKTIKQAEVLSNHCWYGNVRHRPQFSHR